MRARVHILAICTSLGSFALASQATAAPSASHRLTQAHILRYNVGGDGAGSSQPITKTNGMMKLLRAHRVSVAPNRYQVLRNSF